MKTLQYRMIAVLLIVSLMSACKKETINDSTVTETETPVDTISYGSDMSDTELDATATGVSNATISDGADGNSGKRVSGNGRSPSVESQGSTTSTSVNKAQRKEQAARNTKGNYSAPDGTPAENRDGDMYTKHDTTRMPSGSVPIK